MGNFCKIPSNEDLDLFVSNKLQKDSPREKITIKEIDELKKEIMNIQLFKKNTIANQKYNEYLNNKTKLNQEKKDFIGQYIEVYRLLLLNDTNKNIVILYLNFIKENEVSIKKHCLIPFNEEIQKYKLLFTVEEMNKIQKGLKKESEKTKFISFLKKLSLINDDNDIKFLYKDIGNDPKPIKYFNYPI